MKYSGLTFLIILFCSLYFNSKAQDTIFLWKDIKPKEIAGYPITELSADKNRDVIRYSKVINHVMIAYETKSDTDQNISVIICPGGGYSHLSANIEGYEVAEWLNSVGINAYVLLYRVPDKRDSALMDIRQAIKIVKSNTNNKVGLIGFSAGGHLSARAATTFDAASIDTSLIKNDCRPDFAALIYPAYLDLGLNNTLSPEITINESTPPFFIYGCQDDKHGNSSLVMAIALKDKNIPVELHFYQEGGHGYGLRSIYPAAREWPELFIKWLKKNTE